VLAEVFMLVSGNDKKTVILEEKDIREIAERQNQSKRRSQDSDT